MTITREALEAAVHQLMPGYKLSAEQSPTVTSLIGPAPNQEAATHPSVEELRKRFLEPSAPSNKEVQHRETFVVSIEHASPTENDPQASTQKKFAFTVSEDGTIKPEAVQG